MEDLIDMIRKDEQAKAQANLNRIASELRTYYSDIMAAKKRDLPKRMRNLSQKFFLTTRLRSLIF